ncbi:MAG: FeoA family protein [Kiritimatiellales bacterium]
MKLKEMKAGETGKISGYSTSDKLYRQKLIQMGLVKGVEFKLIRIAPLGDPAEISIHGCSVTLRKAEADALEVEKI